MTLLGMVRAFTGPRWQPSEIGLMTHDTPCRYIREQFSGTRMRLSQPFSYISLENTLLTLPPLLPEPTTPESSPLAVEATADDFVGSLKQILSAYVGDRNPSLAFAAALCDTSKRSLQRKLAKSGTRFSGLLSEVRFDAACRRQSSGVSPRIRALLQAGCTCDDLHSKAFRYEVLIARPQGHEIICNSL